MNEYKLIVAGGRDFNNRDQLADTLLALAGGELADKAVSIVSGMANGADALGYHFAVTRDIKLYSFPADWNKYGKGAGYRRNEDMGRFADGVVAFWDGKSKGTEHMIQVMKRLGKQAFIVNY